MDEFKIALVCLVADKSTGKLLIGRRENDPYVKGLKWSFIGGRLNYGENPKEKIGRLIEESIGVSALNVKLISSMPHSNQENMFMNYFYCELGEGKLVVKGSFVGLKWVSLDELEDCFTTTLQPDVKEYIEGKLECQN